MKNIIKSLLAIAGATMLISACSTDVEIKDPANLTDPARSEEYYAALQLTLDKYTDKSIISTDKRWKAEESIYKYRKELDRLYEKVKKK